MTPWDYFEIGFAYLIGFIVARWFYRSDESSPSSFPGKPTIGNPPDKDPVRPT